MPRTIAPTKAKARYAVNTLSLLTKVMGTLPWFTSLPALTAQSTNRSRVKKGSAAVAPAGSKAASVVKGE
jgi:hypothetical protein